MLMPLLHRLHRGGAWKIFGHWRQEVGGTLVMGSLTGPNSGGLPAKSGGLTIKTWENPLVKSSFILCCHLDYDVCWRAKNDVFVFFSPRHRRLAMVTDQNCGYNWDDPARMLSGPKVSVNYNLIWCFGTCFFHILGIIVPTDWYFSAGLKPPTSNPLIMKCGWKIPLKWKLFMGKSSINIVHFHCHGYQRGIHWHLMLFPSHVSWLSTKDPYSCRWDNPTMQPLRVCVCVWLKLRTQGSTDVGHVWLNNFYCKI